MCRYRDLLLVLVAMPVLAQGQPYAGIGRVATPAELAAWDIDVRPDFKGLPPGSGSVRQGQEVWEAQCASCHGIFGESNQTFNPLVGGTTAEDVRSGRVASLRDGSYPGRTTLMKLPSLSSLWDYINRAMPWNRPKSLSSNEVYAVTAYMLHLGGVVADDYVLSDKTMAEAQARLPNRLGMTTEHGLWPGRGLGRGLRPDVQGSACMVNCATRVEITSALPAHARDAHGNLAEQNRLVGPLRGVDTRRSASVVEQQPKPLAGAAGPDPRAVTALVQRHACTTCHAQERKLLGPSWAEVARRQAGKTDYLAGKIRAGGAGVWGALPMPAQSLNEAEARQIAAWLANGANPGIAGGAP